MDARADDPVTRRHIERNTGVLFQDGALFSTLTVRENVEVPMRPLRLEAGVRRKLADLKIAMAGLPPDAGDKYPSQLSGGMRKRAGLARALALDPAILFLDEPTAGLDPHARLDVWDLLRERRDEGVALVVTTHGFEEAERLADRVVILAGGRVVADGTPDEIADGARLEDAYFALTGGLRDR